MREVKKTQRTKRPKKNRQENIMAEENKTTTQSDSGPISSAAQSKFESSKTQARKAARKRSAASRSWSAKKAAKTRKK